MTESHEACAEGRFRIAADGTWFHDRRPIPRLSLVRLFAGILRRDADGTYWLATPVETVPVEVEDAPFVAVALEVEGAGRDRTLVFRTNIGARVPLDADHPLRVRAGPAGPRPYLELERGLEARIVRSVYYELAELAEGLDGPGPAGVWSAGRFFPLEPDGAEGDA